MYHRPRSRLKRKTGSPITEYKEKHAFPCGKRCLTIVPRSFSFTIYPFLEVVSTTPPFGRLTELPVKLTDV